jgi:voltage-gated potassium channel
MTTTGTTHPRPPGTAARLLRWEQVTDLPLTAAAALFLAVYALPILDTGIAQPWRHICTDVALTMWILFAVDYLTRLTLADRRWDYCWRHLPDLAIVALPVLRPLRLLRLVLLLRVLNRRAAASLYGRIIIYVTGATALLLICASLAVLDAERHNPNANITSYADALWWSATTITTVGYGDRYPITGEGRFVAIGLMIGGIALLGIITASIASWMINHVRDAEQAAQAITHHDIHQLAAKIDELRTLITQTATTNATTNTNNSPAGLQTQHRQ